MLGTRAQSVEEHEPSNWSITSVENGITAYNVVTGTSFQGTIDEFNAVVRGKVQPAIDLDVFELRTGKPNTICRKHLLDITTFYVRPNGKNGDGLSNTDESAWDDLASLLEHIYNNYELRSVAIIQLGIGYIGRRIAQNTWPQAIAPLCSIPAAIFIVSEDVNDPAVIGDLYIRNNTASCNFLFSDVAIGGALYLTGGFFKFTDTIKIIGTGSIVLDCVVEGQFLGSFELDCMYTPFEFYGSGTMRYEYAEAGANIKFLRDLDAPLFLVDGDVLLDITENTYDLNGFEATGPRYSITRGARIIGPADQSSIPGIAGTITRGASYLT